MYALSLYTRTQTTCVRVLLLINHCKMRQLIFFICLVFSGPLLNAQKAILFTDALRDGQITFTVKSQGGHSGQCLSVHFEKMTDKPLRLSIPAGHIFEPKDSTYQNIIIVKNEEFTLTKTKQFVRINGLCAQSGDASPAVFAMFELGKMAEGNLLKMAVYIAEQRLWNESDAQYAIWCMSDSLPVASISHKGLLSTACQLLGQPLPQYKLNYPTAPPTSRTRQPVLEKTPFSAEGAFEYQSNTEKEISVYVLNEAKERVRTVFEGQRHLPGWAKYSFYFKTTQLPPGKYEVVMYADKQPVKKIKIIF